MQSGKDTQPYQKSFWHHIAGGSHSTSALVSEGVMQWIPKSGAGFEDADAALTVWLRQARR